MVCTLYLEMLLNLFSSVYLTHDEELTKILVGSELANCVLTWGIGFDPLPPVMETGYYQRIYRLRGTWSLWVCLSWSRIHVLGKQFILCHSPQRIALHHTEFIIQLALYVGKKFNRPRHATVIPMTHCMLPFYHRSPLYTRHIKCWNTKREITWHKCALHTYTYQHIAGLSSQKCIFLSSLLHNMVNFCSGINGLWFYCTTSAATSP